MTWWPLRIRESLWLLLEQIGGDTSRESYLPNDSILCLLLIYFVYCFFLCS